MIEKDLEQIKRFYSHAPVRREAYPKPVRLVLLLVLITPFLAFFAFFGLSARSAFQSFLLKQLLLWPAGLAAAIFLCAGLYFRIMPNRVFHPTYPAEEKFSFRWRAVFYFFASALGFWAAIDFLNGYP